MGLFDKIKSVLFEDDEEDELQEMPVYTEKEEVKEVAVVAEEPEVQPIVEEPIKMDEKSHFRNIKRDIDIDLSFEESDVLIDIPIENNNYRTIMLKCGLGESWKIGPISSSLKASSIF
mgnify:CR=1 FL=1